MSCRTVSILVAFTVLLSACGGGGGDSAGADAAATPGLDVSGLWTTDSADPATTGMFLSVGDQAYGFQLVGGTTLRYFKGTGYQSSATGYSFGASRYDEFTGSTVAGGSGQLTGQLVPGSVPSRLSVGFAATAGSSGSFPAMTVVVPDSSVGAVPDARNFTGAYPLQTGGSMTFTATSSSGATLNASSVNGCSLSGTINLPRGDRNVWVVALRQSACTDARRNGGTTQGLGFFYVSGATRNIVIVGDDGIVWTLLSSSL